AGFTELSQNVFLFASISLFFFYTYGAPRDLHSFPTRRSSDLTSSRFSSRPRARSSRRPRAAKSAKRVIPCILDRMRRLVLSRIRSEEHTSELQSRGHLVCRLLLEKKNKTCSETTVSPAAPQQY